MKLSPQTWLLPLGAELSRIAERDPSGADATSSSSTRTRPGLPITSQYLQISTHIYSYLQISTNIYTYLHISRQHVLSSQCEDIWEQHQQHADQARAPHHITISINIYTYLLISTRIYTYHHNIPNIYSYLLLSTHIFRYLLISTDIYSYLQISTHIYRYLGSVFWAWGVMGD